MAIDGVIARSVKERSSTIIEGIHLHPAYHEHLKNHDALLVPVLLTVPSRNELRQHLAGRGRRAPSRGAGGYLENIESIWQLQTHLVGEAEEREVPVIPNVHLDETVRRVIEVITDMPISDYFSEKILGPLGMEDTSFTISPAKVDRFAEIYGPDAEGRLVVMDPAIVGEFGEHICFHSTGGGLISTAADYLRFGQLVLNQGELDGVRLLGRKTLELMTMNHIPGELLPISMGEEMPGIGFGLGFSVSMNPADAAVLGSIGNVPAKSS